jgi:hypothetical protein
VLVAEHADARRVQNEPRAVFRRQAEPAAARTRRKCELEKIRIGLFELARICGDDVVGPGADIGGGFPIRAAVAEELPAGAPGQDLRVLMPS